MLARMCAWVVRACTRARGLHPVYHHCVFSSTTFHQMIKGRKNEFVVAEPCRDRRVCARTRKGKLEYTLDGHILFPGSRSSS